MNAKPLAEMALQLWNRMGERPLWEKESIITTLANWLQAEARSLQAAPALNSQMNSAAPPPLPADEHFRA